METLAWLGASTSSPLQALCRTDLTIADFFKNDLGKFTPCFVDLVILGARIAIALIALG